MIGKTVGKYRITDRLGRGGMGTVYRAVDETLDREVAIKVLNPDLGDADVLKRFRGEAVTLARLNHPGIATIYELYREDDDLLMVMEYVRGETLHVLAERLGPLAAPQAAHLCMQVLEALGYAHRAGIVHRDLKPANVMLADTGAVKVMDFGIARVMGTEHVTHGGYMMGTPAYMAPEQVLGREVDRRADLYSVGVLFYRLLAGELPFRADTSIGMVQKQISEQHTPLRTFRPDLADWCGSIINRALAKSPADRFQSAEEFRAGLLAVVKPETLGEMPTLATPTPYGLPIGLEVTGANEQRTVTFSGSLRAPAPSSGQLAPGATGTKSSAALATPLTSPPLPTDRTTTLVLGRTHLFTLGGLLVVLALGVAVLAFVALRPAVDRGARVQPDGPPPQVQAVERPSPPAGAAATTGAPPVPAPADAPASPPSPARAAGDSASTTRAAVPLADAGRSAKAPLITPPGTSATGRESRGTAKAEAPVPVPAAPPVAPPVPPEAAAPAAVLPPLDFHGVRLIVTEGEKTRERVGVLHLADGQVTMLDRAGGTAIAAVPHSGLVAAFYSRSKQPRWKGADGKEVVGKVDLGKLGFMRADRNWLVLLTPGDPVLLRLDDGNLNTILPALHERTGIPVQRFAK